MFPLFPIYFGIRTEKSSQLSLGHSLHLNAIIESSKRSTTFLLLRGKSGEPFFNIAIPYTSRIIGANFDCMTLGYIYILRFYHKLCKNLYSL